MKTRKENDIGKSECKKTMMFEPKSHQMVCNNNKLAGLVMIKVKCESRNYR